MLLHIILLSFEKETNLHNIPATLRLQNG
uniref:Uncharacterized protein n=1 Tax=Rhizophora mucronata TaxID=61149 RepID=A0A2P2QNP8_RHIMU